jgi:hypothetical protein
LARDGQSSVARDYAVRQSDSLSPTHLAIPSRGRAAIDLMECNFLEPRAFYVRTFRASMLLFVSPLGILFDIIDERYHA